MEVYRIPRHKNFNIVSNIHLWDRRLHWKTKGILTMILSLPEDWILSQKGLTTLSVDGIDGVRSSFKELMEKGYMSKVLVKDESGKFTGCEYIIFEDPRDNPEYTGDLSKACLPPKMENPTSVIKSTNLPKTENPTSVDNNILKPKTENPISVNLKTENPTLLNINNKQNTKSTKYQSINLSKKVTKKDGLIDGLIDESKNESDSYKIQEKHPKNTKERTNQTHELVLKDKDVEKNLKNAENVNESVTSSVQKEDGNNDKYFKEGKLIPTAAREEYEKIIKENIRYGIFEAKNEKMESDLIDGNITLEEYEKNLMMWDLKYVDKIISFMLDLITSLSDEPISISGEKIDRSIVKKRMLEVKTSDMTNAIKTLKVNDVKNPKKYVISVLYNG